MESDYEWLNSKNIEIGNAESAGNQGFFQDLLAPAFAFRRVKGDIVDRNQFVTDLKRGPERETEIDSIAFVGTNRAVVTCIVAMEVEDTRRRFHNLRLFVRKPGSDWKLLAWANEAI